MFWSPFWKGLAENLKNIPILPTFFFFPAQENARYAKMVFRLRIGKLHSFYKYIKRLLGSKNEKKNLQKDWKNK